jgi:photosystem II stability/assembly factor-like uncharacterized protein
MSGQGCLPRSAQGRRTRYAATAALTILLWLGAAAPLPAHAERTVQESPPPVWQPLNGPGGPVSSLASEAGTANLYAAVEIRSRRRDDQTQWLTGGAPIRSAALYRSTDGGATWQPATNDFIPGPITALFADPATGAVYAGLQSVDDNSAGRSGLWTSTDRGTHWQQVSLGREALRIERILRNARDTHLLLGAVETTADTKPASFVYRSSDAGVNWESSRITLNEDRPDSVLADLTAHPSISNRLFVTTHAGEIYVSEDLGRTWRVALEGSPAPAPAAAPETGASMPPAAVGTSYLAISTTRPDTLVAARAEPAAGGSSKGLRLEVHRSSDGGAQWSVLSTSGLPADAVPNTLAALPGGVFLLNTDYGTYRSTDAGATWQLLEGPLSSGDAAAFVTIPGSPASVLASTAYGLFASKDAGAIWQAFGKGLPFNSSITGLLTDVRQPNRVFAISYAERPADGTAEASAAPLVRELKPPMLLRSVDGGSTWTPASQGLPGVDPMAWTLDPNDPNTLFISSRERMFRTTDAGLKWQTASLPAGGHYALAIAPSDSNVVYAGGNPPLRSADRGASWKVLTPVVANGSGEVTGLIVDATDVDHVWAGLDGEGVYESRDGGSTWRLAGLEGKRVRWLAGAAGSHPLYAGVTENGIYRWSPQTRAWTPASGGLPDQSTILSFAADPGQTGVLWAGRDGGGIYRSADSGATWVNVSTTGAAAGAAGQRRNGAGTGDNLALALAVDYTAGGSVYLGTATAGLWALRAQNEGSRRDVPRAVDARIELVWPHNSAPVAEARLANIGLRLFAPNSLEQPPCGWGQQVAVWWAKDSDPAQPLDNAKQRTVDGNVFPLWEVNDVDVSYAMEPRHKLTFMIQASGIDSATNIWTHGADPRTYYPFPEVPSGIATGEIDAVDARVRVVWPHDADGNLREISEAVYANVSVALFKHGTRLSVPIDWRPDGGTLYGAWNQEIGRPLSSEAVIQVRKAGAITYPTWEFNNIPVGRAMDPANKLHMWFVVDGVDTYPSIWTHGADARTLFPVKDEPVQGCVP